MTSGTTDRSLDLVQRVLQTVGYDSRAIVLNYDFAVPNGGNSLSHVDLAAFSDPVRHDLRTSCIAAQRVSGGTDIEESLGKLSYLAVPWALFLEPEAVGVWPVASMGNPQPVRHVPYDDLQQFFYDHISDFRPDSLVAAKTNGHQLSFSELDRTLLEFAFEATQEILVDRFEAAVTAAKNALGEATDRLPNDVKAIVLQLLAAAVLDDKHLLGNDRCSSAEDLMQRSVKLYGRYFHPLPRNPTWHSVAEITFETLRRNVTFRSFTNEMLGYFYEHALVDKSLRKEMGIHYTPRSIAKRILARMPIEDIPPSNRFVFDGSCGSGNLLIAAYERMLELLPSYWDTSQKHEHLVKRVHGVDLDPFATQVAGLSLLFMDLSGGDAWNLQTGDVIAANPESWAQRPTILVGNPPFRELRSLEGQRSQRASLFLNKYLDVLEPEGLIGMVLPETFLENSSCRDARRRLLEECELLELWQLPEGIFPTSSAATLVVIARKRPSRGSNSGGPVRVQRVSALLREKNGFLNGDRPRFSYVLSSTDDRTKAPDTPMSTSPLDRCVWDSLQSVRTLGQVAHVRNGIIPGKKQRDDHFESEKRGPEWKPWIRGSSDFEPYALKPKQTTFVLFPGGLQWPRTDLEAVFETPNSKVLVNSARAPGNPWRLFAAVDDIGYFPSQGIHCVIPKDATVSLEEVVAFLNSSVASAWIDSRNRRRWIGEDTLRDMPFPVFTGAKRELMRQHATDIMNLKESILERPSRLSAEVAAIRNHAIAVDELVCDALGISEEGRAMLNSIFAGYRRPGLEWRDIRSTSNERPSVSNGRKWPVTGQVIDMDAEGNAATIWVRGYNENEPFRITIPEDMPGWALRPEVAFEAEIPWINRDSERFPVEGLTNFRPMDFSYVGSEELAALLANPQTLNELYGC